MTAGSPSSPAVKAGPEGMAAGGIPQAGHRANTMSAQLLVLSNAGLVHAGAKAAPLSTPRIRQDQRTAAV